MTRILEESNLDLRRTVQHMQVWMHSNDAPSNAVGVEEDVDILDIGASPSLPASSPLTRLDSTASPGSVEESAVDPSEGIQLLRRLDRLHSVASFMDAWADRDSVEALSVSLHTYRLWYIYLIFLCRLSSRTSLSRIRTTNWATPSCIPT